MAGKHFEDEAVEVTLTYFPYIRRYIVCGEIFYKHLNEKHTFDKQFNTALEAQVFIKQYMRGVRK